MAMNCRRRAGEVEAGKRPPPEASSPRMLRDPCWVKSRIGARILLRAEAGKLTARDIRLARRFGNDRGVEDRLLDQALASIGAEKRRRGLLPPHPKNHVPAV